MMMAQETMGTALDGAHNSFLLLKEHVQRGPDGISWLCFVGGLATTVLGILGFFSFFAAVMEPVDYSMHLFEASFGVTTCVLEAPAKWVEKMEKLERAQKFIEEFAKFLTTLGGRGLFYLFQGSLTFATEPLSVTTALSIYMCGCGVVCIGMQYGFVFPGNERQKSFKTQVYGDYIHIEP